MTWPIFYRFLSGTTLSQRSDKFSVVYDVHDKSLPVDLLDLFRLSTNTIDQILNGVLSNLTHIPKQNIVLYGNHSMGLN